MIESCERNKVDDIERIKQLHSYQLHDNNTSIDFEGVTRLAAQICECPIAQINIVDQTEQWTKAGIGLESKRISLAESFCRHAIQEPSGMIIVADATKDSRFQNNPLVLGYPGIRFYAGISLVNASGYALGALCVIDTKFRELSQSQIEGLHMLAKQVVQNMELHRGKLKFVKQSNQLVGYKYQNEVLVREVHHRVKNNLQFISSLLSLRLHWEDKSNHVKSCQFLKDKIRILAAVQEIAYDIGDMTKVEIPEFLSSFVNHFNQNQSTDLSKGVNYTVRTSYISQDSAIHLGLILNEFFTHLIELNTTNRELPIISLIESVDHAYILQVSGKPKTNNEDPDEVTFSRMLIQIFVEQLNAKLITKTENNRISYFLNFIDDN